MLNKDQEVRKTDLQFSTRAISFENNFGMRNHVFDFTV